MDRPRDLKSGASHQLDEACQGILAWHVREGHFGHVRLDGLNVLALGAFEGNLWAGEAKARMGLYIDAKADARQR